MGRSRVFRTTDVTGAASVHLAIDDSAAAQAHLVHFGLLHVEFTSIEDLGPLKDWTESRRCICWDARCILASMTPTEENHDEQRQG